MMAASVQVVINEPLVVNVTYLVDENLIPVRKTLPVLEIFCHDVIGWSDL